MTDNYSSNSTEALPGIQALRALAASAVLVAHTGGEFEQHLSLHGLMPSFANGGAGVDLFFVISGFVMVYSSERLFNRPASFRTFLTRRIIRIVPLYWTMTSVMLLWVIVRGFAASDASPIHALASYFFIPYARPSGPIDPLYGLGWTLNYEMMFYLIFACALFAPRNIAVVITSAVLLTMAIIHSFQLPMPRQIAYLTDPIILEFIFGMGIALLVRTGARLPQFACFLLVGFAVVIPLSWLWIPSLWLWTGGLTRWELWGVPAAMIVTAVVLVDRPLIMPLLIVAVGDASYALYLVHPGVNFIVRHGANRGLFFDAATLPWVYLVSSLCLSVLVAFAVYYCFERPISKFLKGYFAIPGKKPQLSRAFLAQDNSMGPHGLQPESLVGTQKAF
jgi:exopolysaccharide production protein ExoZ